MTSDGLTSREVALAIIPHITGGLSMLGSAYIVLTVLRSKTKRAKSYHRLLVAMSASDIVSSFSYFLSTWPIPQVGPGGVGGWNQYGGSPYHYAAVGTPASCAAQGFGIQFGVLTTATYNVMLAVHYLLTIRWNYSETRLRTKVEPFMLSIPPLVGLGLSIPEIFLKYYNDTNLWCWIKASWEYDDAVKRSYNARWGFAYGPLWAFILFITLAQVYLWWTVRSIEKKVQRFRSFNTAQEQTKHSRRVASQAALYVAVFYVTNLPYTTIAATQRFYNPHTTGGFVALLAVVIFAPWQGFLNVFVYRRQQIVKAAKNVSRRTDVSGASRRIAKSFGTSSSAAGDKSSRKVDPDVSVGGTKTPVLKSCDDDDKFMENEEEDRTNVEVATGEAEPTESEPFIPAHVSEVYED